MKCKKCKSEMVIDEWDGWRWYCMGCDLHGGIATDADINDHEDDVQNEYRANRKRKEKQ